MPGHFEFFEKRHIGPRESDLAPMLSEMNLNSIDELLEQTIPSSIRLKKDLDLPGPLSEIEFLEEFQNISQKNQLAKNYIGQGYYPCITPSVILRNILENPGWYTQYTPYQSEISQGRLEALINFQTMVMDLCGMEVANASLLDEATAAAEAMFMLYNIAQKKPALKNAKKFLVDEYCFPHTLDVLKTRANPLGIEIVSQSVEDFTFNKDVFGILVQYPNRQGALWNCEELIKKANDANCPSVVAVDLLSLCLLKPPGEFGAHIVVGNSQRFGVPMGFGGPHAAFFATREEYKRLMPGRIIGVSKDAKGNIGYRMALQTREQHIRREKATSNICTAQVLLAIMASMYAVYHGPKGLFEIAQRVHYNAMLLLNALKAGGYKVLHHQVFDSIALEVKKSQHSEITRKAKNMGINLNNHIGENLLGISLDETTSPEDLKNLAYLFGVEEKLDFSQSSTVQLDSEIQRSSPFLTHPVFNSYHSETEMMRYIKKLESKDLSLNWSMIPLGSCTMKLNAATQMIPVSWANWNQIHPFAPASQTLGYQELIEKLSRALQKITGFEAVSLQPNAGAQGEYTGLLVIRAYHEKNGQTNRNIALIPSSAHGTNPASAALAGMEIVVVACDIHGNIDMDDLKSKALEHKENLSCTMITYPSTHGVFEDEIREICQIIHDNGGLVYMDGANMNAQVGLTSPAEIGADVCHLNLHKTFSIPHGGGGPGMGPIAVNHKLAPFLPGHSLIKIGGSEAISAVSAAPYGSASILGISWGYIRMLGAKGVRRSSEIAILNANYLLQKLKDHYPVLYTGKKGRVAHEFILDFRPFKHSANVEVVDIAKRLMDYGFHAPTVSFPVAGTLMIEPTESESKEELDRFAEALISIRAEISEIESGSADKNNNVLKNAPHTARTLTEDPWPYPYSRKKAVYPLGWVEENKFWPAVSRIDNTYGDKNLVCSCPGVESYATQVS